MDTFKFQLELPRDLLVALKIPDKEVAWKTKEWIALELFREGEISAGKAAEMLGLTKSQFINLLNQRGIPYLDLGPEELAQDISSAVAATK